MSGKGTALKKHTGKNTQIAMQDYKSQVKITAVMICETLVNSQTHTDRQTTTDWLYYQFSFLS